MYTISAAGLSRCIALSNTNQGEPAVITMLNALADNFIAAIEIAGNRVLTLDDNVIHRCGELQGSCIAITFTDLEQTLYCHPGSWGIRLSRNPPTKPADATISGRVMALVSMALEEDSVSTSIREQLSFEGNVGIAQQMQKIIIELDIDWEEVLSEYTGDVLAFQLHQKTRQAADFFKQGLQSFMQTNSEYLREEARVTPTQPEFDDFQQQLNSLRQDVDRAEARLRQLLNKTRDKQLT
jgi:ubiquinone biosynthesis protein UbiJ